MPLCGSLVKLCSSQACPSSALSRGADFDGRARPLHVPRGSLAWRGPTALPSRPAPGKRACSPGPAGRQSAAQEIQRFNVLVARAISRVGRKSPVTADWPALAKMRAACRVSAPPGRFADFRLEPRDHSLHHDAALDHLPHNAAQPGQGLPVEFPRCGGGQSKTSSGLKRLRVPAYCMAMGGMPGRMPPAGFAAGPDWRLCSKCS